MLVWWVIKISQNSATLLPCLMHLVVMTVNSSARLVLDLWYLGTELSSFCHVTRFKFKLQHLFVYNL